MEAHVESRECHQVSAYIGDIQKMNAIMCFIYNYVY